MKHILKCILSIQFLAIATIVFCQNSKKDSLTPILTADSLASGNYKDILTSFYQLAVNNLTGPNKELKFTSNPYAIMLKHNKNLDEDIPYQKYRFLRNLNLSLDARLDSNYQFNGMSFGAVYAIYNGRDITVGREFARRAVENVNDLEYAKLFKYALDSIKKLSIDTTIERKIRDIIDSAWNEGSYKISNQPKSISFITFGEIAQIAKNNGYGIIADSLNSFRTEGSSPYILRYISDNKIVLQYKQVLKMAKSAENIKKIAVVYYPNDLALQLNALYFDSTYTFDKCDSKLQGIIKYIIKTKTLSIIDSALQHTPKLDFYKEKNSGFINLKEEFKRKPLWTIGASDTTYASGLTSKSAQIFSELTFGIGGNPHSTLAAEFDLKASLNFADDTSQTGKNLSRHVLNIEPGINFVLKGKENQQSFLEFKLSGSIGLYTKETQWTNTLNGTLRIRIFDELWLPLTIKYDPKHGNIFGFLNVTTNFTGLGSLLKGQQPPAKL